MIRNRRPKVLLGIPTYDGKNYCLTRFVRGIHALNKDGFQVRVLFVDNTADGGKNAKMIEAVSGYTCHHLDVSHCKTINEKLAMSHERLRQAAIAMKADYLFHVESDLLLDPMTLHALYTMNAPIATSGYSIGTGGHRYPLISNVADATPKAAWPFFIDTCNLLMYHRALKSRYGTGMNMGLGVMLIRKEVFLQIPFRAQTKPVFPDSTWSAECSHRGYFPKYNLSVFAHHLNDLGWGADHEYNGRKFSQSFYKTINHDT